MWLSGIERRSIVYSCSLLFFLARSARTCSRRCQCPSMINILCTAFWVPCRVIHTIRCSWLKGLNDWFCCRSRWRACRSGWFSILWINSRTLALCACFTRNSGNPGILKSMFSAILSRVNSLSVLSVIISRCTSGAVRSATLCLSGCPTRTIMATIARRRLVEDRDTILEFTGKIQELQNEN